VLVLMEGLCLMGFLKVSGVDRNPGLKKSKGFVGNRGGRRGSVFEDEIISISPYKPSGHGREV
jgi:hypothetical protein